MTIPRVPHSPEPDGSDERSLRRLDSPREPGPGATLHAMAEALRANADAMHQIDSSQRQMAESVRRSDRAAQVVTSTKALNETFRGLSEIQRGLLDSLARERSRKVSAGPWPYLSLVLLLTLLAILAGQQLSDDTQIPRDLYEDARRDADQTRGRAAVLETQVGELRGRQRESDHDLKALRERSERDATELGRTKEELGRNKAQVAQYLKVKDQADAAAGVLLANEQLQRDNADLRRQLERARTMNDQLIDKFRTATLDGQLGDPTRIIAEARRQKAIPEAVKHDLDAPRTTRELTRIRRRLKRLFEGAAGEEGYELLQFKGIGDDGLLTEVEVGRYEKHQTVASIRAKSLEIRVDPKTDRLEMRFSDGYMVNLTRPQEKIPLDPEGHSVFLKGVGVKGWLEYVGDTVILGPEGQLVWK